MNSPLSSPRKPGPIITALKGIEDRATSRAHGVWVPAFAGRLKNRHSGARRRREPGIHSHNTIILACLYDEATGFMDSGLLASLGPGMTRSYAPVPLSRGRPQRLG